MNMNAEEQINKLGYEKALAVYKMSQSGNTSHEPESQIALSVQEMQTEYKRTEKKAMTARQRKAAYTKMLEEFENERALVNIKKAKQESKGKNPPKIQGLNPLQIYELKKKDRDAQALIQKKKEEVEAHKRGVAEAAKVVPIYQPGGYVDPLRQEAIPSKVENSGTEKHEQTTLKKPSREEISIDD